MGFPETDRQYPALKPSLSDYRNSTPPTITRNLLQSWGANGPQDVGSALKSLLVEKAPLLPPLEVEPTGMVSVSLFLSLSPGGSGLLTQPF